MRAASRRRNWSTRGQCTIGVARRYGSSQIRQYSVPPASARRGYIGCAGQPDLPGGAGPAESAVAWLEDAEGFIHSYCNTIPTTQGGTHEAGFRAALLKGLRAWGEQRGNRRAAQVVAEDLLGPSAVKLSVFLRDPQFQGQTKEKLTTVEATRLIETALRDRFDHWLAGDPMQADNLLTFVVERAEDRLRRR